MVTPYNPPRCVARLGVSPHHHSDKEINLLRDYRPTSHTTKKKMGKYNIWLSAPKTYLVLYQVMKKEKTGRWPANTMQCVEVVQVAALRGQTGATNLRSSQLAEETKKNMSTNADGSSLCRYIQMGMYPWYLSCCGYDVITMHQDQHY